MKSWRKVNLSYITLHSHALDIHIDTAGRLHQHLQFLHKILSTTTQVD